MTEYDVFYINQKDEPVNKKVRLLASKIEDYAADLIKAGFNHISIFYNDLQVYPE